MDLGDVFSPEERSRIMSRIGSKNTKPEIAVRRLVHSKGFRFRLHDKKLPGKPDVVLPRHRKVIFVNGCFWHGHNGCSRSSLPKTNSDFWRDKIAKTVQRDKRTVRQLRRQGWGAMTVWQCETKNLEKLSRRLDRYLHNKR